MPERVKSFLSTSKSLRPGRMRFTLLLLETLRECKVSIMSARETFEPKIAPLRAWIAPMKLDGIKERMTMGIKARLIAGKASTGPVWLASDWRCQ